MRLMKTGVAVLALAGLAGISLAADKGDAGEKREQRQERRERQERQERREVREINNARNDFETVMAERGKLLVSDDFSSTLDPAWQKLKGKWEVVDGSLKGVELKSDNHPAVIRRDLKTKDLIAQFSFKLGTAKQVSFSLNGPKGHICRVIINKEGFSLVRDKDKKDAADKPGRIAARQVAISPGEWHTMVVEVVGNEMLASLDGGRGKEKLAFGTDKGVAAEKTNFGFPTAGEGVLIDNVKIWEATPKKDWDQRKKELAAK